MTNSELYFDHNGALVDWQIICGHHHITGFGIVSIVSSGTIAEGLKPFFPLPGRWPQSRRIFYIS